MRLSERRISIATYQNRHPVMRFEWQFERKAAFVLDLDDDIIVVCNRKP
jgi:hypothetical protein